ncbi:ORF040 [Staphylococcus phage X2]|uniref:ORF040 n=1 Tax=Staphylococcus phage X2 TaxID=2908152 RepID=Q4ZA86_9CAUD|nr:tail fiber protein [Staphylococcus phage X2]AAX92042.1 ORF040 [Staphylococcus phage X2]
MKITVNDKNEVIGYVNTGGLRNSLDVDDNNVPIKFKEDFEPRKFVFTNGEVKYNNNFEKEETSNTPSQQNASDLSDEELRRMVASMQMQMTQVNMLTMKLTQQNAMLTQQLTELKSGKVNTEGDV